jgi:RHS repeat-associated protein
MTNGTNAAFNYTYDSSGNILTISEGATLKASYTYDKMNQLIREDNVYTSKSIDYVYDVGGNITSRSEYNYTGGVRGTLIKTYAYGYASSWKDQLETISCTGTDCPVEQNFTYDTIGNPLTYRDGLSFAWANGRELATLTNNGISGTYTYNDSGIRTSKTYNGVTTDYTLNGSRIVHQDNGTTVLDFFYDENGNLYGFKEAGAMYYYVRNGQNDIIGILNSTGSQVVSYTYDSWGNPLTPTGSLASTIGADNPFRYRGYYFDSDTGLYYLNSRYYDSTVGRFINADGLVSASSTLLGSNMYGYCENNPLTHIDDSGMFFKEISMALRLTTLVVTVGSGLFSGSITTNDIISDLCNYSPNNSNILQVNSAKVFSSYKGVLVIKQDLFTSFQYGSTIYLNESSSPNIIKHEYGHSIQEDKIGAFSYSVGIAIPSVAYYNIDAEYNLPNNLYFSMPWERTADEYGGATRGKNFYYPGSLELSESYISGLEVLGNWFGFLD